MFGSLANVVYVGIISLLLGSDQAPARKGQLIVGNSINLKATTKLGRGAAIHSDGRFFHHAQIDGKFRGAGELRGKTSN